mmetsp:Transcript_15083/g.31076  ORF Transcript_15083/g.31076 Transcript_15083/m.31076 type:complete len:248 (+) Transcript_15083:1366-2109(+)
MDLSGLVIDKTFHMMMMGGMMRFIGKGGLLFDGFGGFGQFLFQYQPIDTRLFVDKIQSVPSILSRIWPKHWMRQKQIHLRGQPFQQDFTWMFLDTKHIHYQWSLGVAAHLLFLLLQCVLFNVRCHGFDGFFKTQNGHAKHNDIQGGLSSAGTIKKGLRIGEGYVGGPHALGHVRIIGPTRDHHVVSVFAKGLGNELTKATKTNDPNGEGSTLKGGQFFAADRSQLCRQESFLLFQFFQATRGIGHSI